VDAAVHLFEQHDEAYHLWVERGARSRRLVHVDSHHDLAWLDAGAEVTISNYLCQALKDGCVADVIWIAPDAQLATEAARRRLAGQLNCLLRAYRAPRRSPRATADRLRIELLGRCVEIVALDRLPRGLGPVLLDLDTDFLIDRDAPLPRLWPAELAARLRLRDVEAELCTIAYSVDGGYTPLAWKHLGLELAEAMRGENDPRRADAFSRLRAAAKSEARGDQPCAEQLLRQATAAPSAIAAAAWYRLALLLRSAGRTDEARDACRAARTADPSYGTPYASGGFWHLEDNRFDLAQRAFHSALELDPSDGWALVGLARLAEKRREWGSVESWATKALDSDPSLVDAHRLLGRLRERQRRWRDAAAAYRRSLRLALHGRSPLRQPIASRRPPGQRVADVEHGRIYLRVAALEARDGQLDAAAAAYHVGLAVDPRPPLGHARFAALSARRRQWRCAASHVAAACKAVPAAIRRAVRASR
jgi:tetratricopeptide (TPR) repeat protein